MRQPRTSQTANDAARALFDQHGLKVALCNDFAGRILDRLLRPYYNAALRRLDEGLATAGDLDTTLKLGLGYPEGPIELLERTGLAHHYDVTRPSTSAAIPRMPPPAARGWLSWQELSMPPLAGIASRRHTPSPAVATCCWPSRRRRDQSSAEGDEMRSYTPKFGADSVNFALLNRGKRSIAIDLKEPGAVTRLMPLVQSADVIVEQFRPGVMDRLGLGYEAVSRANPRIIYCAITGYGQSGRRAMTAAHDLNYAAETGMLALAAGSDGAPVPPAALVADIGGGSFPAVINILLALREREQSGRGCKLDIAMADPYTFMYWAMGDGLPRPLAAAARSRRQSPLPD